jgi:hypothetical protein
LPSSRFLDRIEEGCIDGRERSQQGNEVATGKARLCRGSQLANGDAFLLDHEALATVEHSIEKLGEVSSRLRRGKSPRWAVPGDRLATRASPWIALSFRHAEDYPTF